MIISWNSDKVVVGAGVHDANAIAVLGEVIDTVKADRTPEITTVDYLTSVSAAGIAGLPDAESIRSVEPVLLAAMANSVAGELYLSVDPLAACEGRRRLSAQLALTTADEYRRAPIDLAVGEQAGDDIEFTVVYVEGSVGPN
ncbi:MAG: hypothetical protein AB7I50_24470 [Vicinamibacterales bacterium]